MILDAESWMNIRRFGADLVVTTAGRQVLKGESLQ
jgi:hypothetical protein